MVSINWNDVNVLRGLSDGWYSVPSDSEYGKKIISNPDIRFNDSVKRASERHDDILRKEREIDKFLKSKTPKNVRCDHEKVPYKGNLICRLCGLMERDDFDPFAFNEGDEDRIYIETKKDEKSEEDIIIELCVKAITVLGKLIDDLDGAGGSVSSFDILEVFGTYILTSEDRGRRKFRISAKLEGLCAALLWRHRKIKMDRMTVSLIVRRLDDYENFKFNKSGRPYGSKGKKKKK
jgi:hypothetical protein